MPETYHKMLAAYESSTAPRITEVCARDCPKNCKRAWTIRSNRGWYALEMALASNARRGPGVYPFLVEDDAGDLYLCGAAAKLLDPNTYGYRDPDKRIARKGYFLMTEERLREMADMSYFADWSWRSTSAHTTCDSLDAAIFMLGLKGIKLDGVAHIKSGFAEAA
jgi:hypothetical protein